MGIALSCLNDLNSATRPTRAVDCNCDAMAGFAARHGQAIPKRAYHSPETSASLRIVSLS